MHVIDCAGPSKILRPFVRQYSQRQARIPGTITVEPVPARSEPILEFQFADPYEIRHSIGERVESAPNIVIVGLQTWSRVRLLLYGSINAFVVVFEPLGFFRLMGASGVELVNQAQDADTAFGNSMTGLWEVLAEARSFAARIQAMEKFLLSHLSPTKTIDVISSVASSILVSNGRVRMREIAYENGLSLRQLERKFLTQIGIPPKAYARIARFGSALRMKANCPNHFWTDIAYQLGYHDQMHMVHDFRELSGESPGKIIAEVELLYRAQLAPHDAFPPKTPHLVS
ncbi:MAG: helix-turn-helix domain-containing protein [Acidobacteriota bacterium]|nr:helix-turn-helix domain-containing protein [Acidobacteriota bacterium]